MLKSNTKQARNNFIEHVKIKLADNDINLLVKDFNANAYAYGYKSFSEWLAYNATRLEYSYFGMRKAIQTALEQNDIDADGYTYSQIEKNYFYFCDRAIKEYYGVNVNIHYMNGKPYPYAYVQGA